MLAIGLLLSKRVLIHFTSLKVYLFSAVFCASTFYLIQIAEKFWLINILSAVLGFFAGIAYFAPVI
jgi:hypothetical protein